MNQVAAVTAELARLRGEVHVAQEAAAAAEANEAATRSAFVLALAEVLARQTRVEARRRAAVAELRLLQIEAARVSPSPSPAPRLGLRRTPPPPPAPVVMDAGDPLFCVPHYLGQDPSLAADETPFAHYLREGWRHGLTPNPLFDPAWYAEQAGQVDGPPLEHYRTEGWRTGRSPHPLFDPAWYLAQNSDVAERGVEPLGHYLTSGWREGREPSPWFSAARYRAVRGDALAPDADPLLDYLQGGAWDGPSLGEFGSLAFLTAHPELAARGLTPLEHWARRSRT